MCSETTRRALCVGCFKHLLPTSRTTSTTPRLHLHLYSYLRAIAIRVSNSNSSSTSRRPRSTRWTTPRAPATPSPIPCYRYLSLELPPPTYRRLHVLRARRRRMSPPRSSTPGRVMYSNNSSGSSNQLSHKSSTCHRPRHRALCSLSRLAAAPSLRRPLATRVRARAPRRAFCRSPSRASRPSRKSTQCLSALTSL